jgi:hypothetical protein
MAPGHKKMPWVRLQLPGDLYIPGTMAKALGLSAGMRVEYRRVSNDEFQLVESLSGLSICSVDKAVSAVRVRLQAILKRHEFVMDGEGPVPVGFGPVEGEAGIHVNLRPGL